MGGKEAANVRGSQRAVVGGKKVAHVRGSERAVVGGKKAANARSSQRKRRGSAAKKCATWRSRWRCSTWTTALISISKQSAAKARAAKTPEYEQ
mmetsp:Transcript_35793/g.106831  ORF Transcript_35793/g.106831 Transcript_35793/m.106831 type:complete len:94 (+) Transcript_35793:545-826(+)